MDVAFEKLARSAVERTAAAAPAGVDVKARATNGSKIIALAAAAISAAAIIATAAIGGDAAAAAPAAAKASVCPGAGTRAAVETEKTACAANTRAGCLLAGASEAAASAASTVGAVFATPAAAPVGSFLA